MFCSSSRSLATCCARFSAGSDIFCCPMKMLNAPSAADPKALMPYLDLGRRSNSLASCTCSVGVSRPADSGSGSTHGMYPRPVSSRSVQVILPRSPGKGSPHVLYPTRTHHLRRVQAPSVLQSPVASRRLVHSRSSSLFPATLGGARGKQWGWQQTRLARCLAPRSTRSTRPLFAATQWYFRFSTARTIFPPSVGSESAQLPHSFQRTLSRHPAIRIAEICVHQCSSWILHALLSQRSDHFPRRCTGVLASVFRSSLSVPGSVSCWLLARGCVSLSPACMVSAWSVGPGCLASPTRVPMYPHCHLMILMVRVATVLLRSCIDVQLLHSLTLSAASCPASLPQLSRSSRPEFCSGKVWGPAPLPPSSPDSHLRRCPFALGSFSWRWSPPSSLPRSHASLCPSLPLLLLLVLEVGIALPFCSAPVCVHAASFICTGYASSSTVSSCLLCASLCMTAIGHRARSVDHSVRPFRGPCRACTRRSRLLLRRL